VPRDGELNVSVTVKNVGSRAGDEVVQLYVRSQDTTYPRPLRQLRGFERISLEKGAEQRVSFSLVPGKDLTRYDEAKKAYVVDPGRYEVLIGASSADIRQTATFTVASETAPPGNR
jgi:beta-glucosidase